LIATANKDLYDFNPSPFSNKYYGVVELRDMFAQHGFRTEFFGNTLISNTSLRQRALRPIKKMAVNLGIIPKTAKGKVFFKRLVFGKMTKMPSEIEEGMISYMEPDCISSYEPDKRHKVIYSSATLSKCGR